MVFGTIERLGENTTELASLLRDQLNYSKIELVEDLEEEEEGLVSYALGASQKLVPVCLFDVSHSQYLPDMNTYKISLQLVSSEESESSSLTRKEFVSAISNFIGDSRQEQQQPLTPLDSSSLTENSENSEPANPPDVITRSYPIHIHNISIKQFKLPQIDLSLTCSQGCNVSLLLEDIKQTLQEQLTRKIQFDSSVFRTAHCGITETSPLCVDKE